MFYRLFGFSSSRLSLDDLEAQSAAADNSSSKSSTSSRSPSPVSQYPLSVMPRALQRLQTSFDEPCRFSGERNFSEMQEPHSPNPSLKSYDSDSPSIPSPMESPSSSRSFSTCLYPIPTILVTPDPKPQIPFNCSPLANPSITRPPPRPALKRGEARPVDIDFIIQRAVSTGAVTSSVWFDKQSSISSSPSKDPLQRSSNSRNMNTSPAAP